MKSDARTVDGYSAARDGAHEDVLRQLRRAILEADPDAVESMKYGMPTYNVGPDVFAFAVQKHYISVYINQEGKILEHGIRNSGLRTAGHDARRNEA